VRSPRQYSWFAGFGSHGPGVWWEAFVHAAEFSRIKALASRAGLTVGFEEQWMDITLHRDGTLFACYEVKRQRKDAELLVRRMME
jgi:hypothetical protein